MVSHLFLLTCLPAMNPKTATGWKSMERSSGFRERKWAEQQLCPTEEDPGRAALPRRRLVFARVQVHALVHGKPLPRPFFPGPDPSRAEPWSRRR
jgi:hypothetical protein